MPKLRKRIGVATLNQAGAPLAQLDWFLARRLRARHAKRGGVSSIRLRQSIKAPI